MKGIKGKKERRSYLLYKVVIGVCAILSSASIPTTFAEPSAIPLARGIGPLPDLRSGARAGVIVTREYADSYRALLPPEVASLLDNGELSFEAALRTRKDLDTPGPSPTASSSLDAISLNENGALQEVPAVVKGPLFPSPTDEEVDRNPQIAAYKVLWNTVTAVWRFPAITEELLLTLYRNEKAGVRRVQMTLSRVYPKELGVTLGSLPALFRELISVRSPVALSGLRWLTFRFSGDTEDYVWAASPITGHSRQLTGSNRSDAIFNGAPAPDDLFVWSGKVEAVKPASIRKFSLLVPFHENEWDGVAVSGDCTTANAPLIELNGDLRRFPQTAAWVPANVIFVPRTLWRIDISTRDAFSLDARQTIYVDAASNLPVYRMVWDQDGRLRRTIIGILGQAPGEGAGLGWHGQIMVLGGEEGRSVLSPQSVSICRTERNGQRVADFDPSLLAVNRAEHGG